MQKDQNVRISLVGDIFPANLPYTCGFGNGSAYLKDKENSWENHLKLFFAESDISFGNLEAPLLNNLEIIDNSSFAGSTLFAHTLKKIRIDIVSISNNHILEYGKEGFFSTLNALSQAGVNFVGVFNNYKSNIVVIEKNNLKFGFAAFNAIKDIPNPNLHADLSLENIYKTLDEMDSLNIDFKLLSFHWGDEYINIPSFDQIKLVHSIVDYGADVIIGHHPHVIQPIERYNKGLIIYSLGNFVFDFLFSNEIKLGMKVDLIFKVDAEIDCLISEVKLNEKSINSVSEPKELREKLKLYKAKMDGLLNQSIDSYSRHYLRTLKINRIYQRIMMKFKLIHLAIFTNNRKQVLRNIKYELSNKKNNSKTSIT